MSGAIPSACAACAVELLRRCNSLRTSRCSCVSRPSAAATSWPLTTRSVAPPVGGCGWISRRGACRPRIAHPGNPYCRNWCCGHVGRRRLRLGLAEGPEKLVAEGVHPLERSVAIGQQAVLPVPGGHLPEHRRIVRDDRDRHLMVGPWAADGDHGLLVPEDDKHEVRVIE